MLLGHYRCRPDLADLDGDGDLDLAVGNSNGNILYFTNTGSATRPAMAERTGSADPFFFFFLGYGSYVSPDIADLDGDGDFDVLVGYVDFGSGGVKYLQNTGSSAVPAFVQVTGSGNPFDGDGDLDVASGAYNGKIRYLANTGSSTSPAFVDVTGSANPFAGIDLGFYSTPEVADLDGDGDLDALIGESGGALVFFRSPLAEVFADGFESGDLRAWAAAFP